MTISRRTFLASLASALGFASMPELEQRVLDLGRPLLLAPKSVAQNLYIYDGGILTLGPDVWMDVERPTWRAVLREEGVDVSSPSKVAVEQRRRSLTDEEFDAPVSDHCWEMVWGTTWSPSARAERLLTRLKVGAALSGESSQAGRLDFHYGDNHPGSNDVWVDVYDDLSATLLQARLIELRQPIRVVMETPTIWRDE